MSIDNLNTVDDNDEFNQYFTEIYPPELQLSQENTTNDQGFPFLANLLNSSIKHPSIIKCLLPFSVNFLKNISSFKHPFKFPKPLFSHAHLA